MAEAGFKEIGVYVTRRQNTVTKYIATRPIMDLCEQSVWRPGAWVYRRWQEKEGLELEEARDWAAAATDRDEEKSGEEAAQEETAFRR